jgi:hypothetical protein
VDAGGVTCGEPKQYWTLESLQAFSKLTKGW